MTRVEEIVKEVLSKYPLDKGMASVAAHEVVEALEQEYRIERHPYLETAKTPS